MSDDEKRRNPTYQAEAFGLCVPSEVTSAHYTMLWGPGTLARKCHYNGVLLLLSVDALNGHVCHLHAIKWLSSVLTPFSAQKNSCAVKWKVEVRLQSILTSGA